MSLLIIFLATEASNTDNLVHKSKRQNQKFVYTLHHIVASQTTLPGLEASVCVTQQTV